MRVSTGVPNGVEFQSPPESLPLVTAQRARQSQIIVCSRAAVLLSDDMVMVESPVMPLE